MVKVPWRTGASKQITVVESLLDSVSMWVRWVRNSLTLFFWAARLGRTPFFQIDIFFVQQVSTSSIGCLQVHQHGSAFKAAWQLENAIVGKFLQKYPEDWSCETLWTEPLPENNWACWCLLFSSILFTWFHLCSSAIILLIDYLHCWSIGNRILGPFNGLTTTHICVNLQVQRYAITRVQT